MKKGRKIVLNGKNRETRDRVIDAAIKMANEELDEYDLGAGEKIYKRDDGYYLVEE